MTRPGRQRQVTEHQDSVILIGYENRVGDSPPALEVLTAALQSRQIETHDRLVVRNGMFGDPWTATA